MAHRDTCLCIKNWGCSRTRSIYTGEESQGRVQGEAVVAKEKALLLKRTAR